MVDGKWTTDSDAPRETDHEGNENNVLKPEDMVGDMTTGFINTVGPGSTTAQLAGTVPLEKHGEPDLPGGYPETPATELDKQFRVNPLPAVDGAVNPISIAPGQKIPDAIAAESITKYVHLDKDSYEKSDALPGMAGTTDFTINTVGPGSTTAQLAGEVPLEPKLAAVVIESQAKANVDLEPSGLGEEVLEKAKEEKESLQEIQGTSATSTGAASKVPDETKRERTATKVAKDVATPAVTGTTIDLSDPLSAAVAKEREEQEVGTVFPYIHSEVEQSSAEAGKGPEAATYNDIVEEKKTVETELLDNVQPVEDVDLRAGGVEGPKTPETPARAFATTGDSTPSGSNATPSLSPGDKKKKNRLSSLLNKLKPKSNKDKA